MKERIFLIITSISLLIFSFILLRKDINENIISFHTDEAYWISTAKILPLLINKRFNDPIWKEYYAFTNFNGAKYIYSIGLLLFGHSEKTIEQAGVAPDTFYKWKGYDGNAFPKDHAFFRVLTDARIVSALFVSCSIGLMAILGFLVLRSVWLGSIAGIILFFHPITQYIGTHALTDSMFLFFILLSLIGIIAFLNRSKNRISYRLIWFNSFIFAYLASIKINGLLFLFAFIFLIIWLAIVEKSKRIIRSYIVSMCTILFLTSVFFLLLNPNLFFYPTYTLSQMLKDRMVITQYHIALYSYKVPDHVLLSLPQRLHSLIKHSFPIWLSPLFVIGAIYTGFHTIMKRKKRLSVFYTYMIVIGFVVLNGIFTYVVFDEPRYFVPLLPFFTLISVSWLSF